MIFLGMGMNGGNLSYNHSIEIRDVFSGDLVRELEGHLEGVSFMAYSPDGLTLASGAWDSTIKLWDIKSGRLMRDVNPGIGTISSAAFSPNGQMLAFVSGNRVLKMWGVPEQIRK
jgi:WD40 repeat protein